MSKNTEDYIWAIQDAYNLLRADVPVGALAKLPAGGEDCENQVAKAVAVLLEVLEPDDIPAPPQRSETGQAAVIEEKRI